MGKILKKVSVIHPSVDRAPSAFFVVFARVMEMVLEGEKGAASNYITRTQAIRKLQLGLADFRRICILKGIYPHEPKNKKKVGKGSTAPRTYYFKKDIQFLLHEPILQKFREIKAHQRKLFKALTKREWSVAKSLETQTPKYTLDHVIKERYPSFADALRDLDDALSIIFLFASLPSDTIIKASRIKNCQSSQANSNITSWPPTEIHGQDITWIAPYQFALQVPSDVDLKIMSTFLELYETLLSFIDESRDAGGAGLAAYLMESADGKELLDTLAANGGEKSRDARKKIQRRLKTLSTKMEGIQGHDDEEVEDEMDEDEHASADDLGIPRAVVDPTDITEQLPSLEDDTIQDTDKHKLLFKDLVFYLSREVPRNSLEFIIKSFGGKVGWDATSGSGSEFDESDPRITHAIIDRPIAENAAVHPKRQYLQPQWVYDCVNAKKLLKTKGYHVGEELPPHLSPFGNGAEGYDPLEGGDVEMKEAGDEETAEDGEGEEEDAEEEEEEEEDDKEDEDDDEEAIYKAELEAEAAGLTFSEYLEKKAKEDAAVSKKAKPDATAGKKKKVSQAETEAAEEKELAKMMMSKKDRRLYNQIEFGKKKKADEANKLREKRIELEKEAKKAAKKQAVVATVEEPEEAPAPKKAKKQAVVAPVEEPEEPVKKDTKKAAKKQTVVTPVEEPEEVPVKKDTKKAAKKQAVVTPVEEPEEVPAKKDTKKTAKKQTTVAAPMEEDAEAPAKKQVKWAKKDELNKIAKFYKNESPVLGVHKPKPTASEVAAAEEKKDPLKKDADGDAIRATNAAGFQVKKKNGSQK
ncbi:Pescadillo N-terminus-domain-containing protein [Chytridium lagenaria]|nr:Pescadillo N-terminus-domain-containing protein [Chytridium lagenaria]